MPILPSDGVDFDERNSVIVVGAGACGLTAALAASDAGADVLILERDEKPAGSTALSQGNICAAGTRIQAAAGVVDEPEIFRQDIMRRTRNLTDPEMAGTVAREAGPTIDWLSENHAIPFELKRGWVHFGHTRDRVHGVPSGNGEELRDTLLAANRRAGAELRTGLLVDTLFADADGRVAGVAATDARGVTCRIGCDALVLATCGFGANPEMIDAYIPDFAAKANRSYFGHPGNEGHGIRLGMELGADVADMTSFQGHGALADPQRLLVNYGVVMSGGIEVNLDGRRFSNELEDISGQSVKVLDQPDGRAWVVFDEARYDEFRDAVEMHRAQAAKAIIRGETVAELAAATGLPEGALGETLADVADFATGARGDPFGRDFSGKVPLTAPFYAIHVTGALFHTQGGLRVNSDARVLRKDGTPLPNLFAGGGAARGMSGPGVWGYIPASGLCMAVTLGRLAGTAAAAISRA